MSIWKEHSSSKKEPTVSPVGDVFPRAESSGVSAEYAPHTDSPRSAARSTTNESVIGADLAIEGSISGSGNVRLAGRFTGDVTVEGVVTIESGAKLAGGVRATTVVIAGELEGNVVEAESVDILASGALLGDLKAKTLTLAAGSRVRGHIECGWADAPSHGRAAKLMNGGIGASGALPKGATSTAPSAVEHATGA